MTPQDIDKLEAGRELDALIAEKVMGWKWCVQPHGHISRPGRYSYTRWLCEPDRYQSAKPKWDKWDGKTEMPISGLNGEYMHVPEYSSDIAAAWEVVEKMRELQFNHIDIRFHGGRWGVVGYYNLSNNEDFRETTWAYTAPLAICRAALKALSAQQQPQNQQLTELFHNSLTNRGKQVLAQQAIEDLEAQQSLEESECMVGGHAGGCRCHAGEPAKWQLGTS